jgi:uncharacterized protein YyaL (SSP411 family)
MSEDKLFYSASDADSEGEEGTYFTYTYDEVKNILQKNGYKDIDNILDEISVTKDGNFEGKNIVRIQSDKITANFDDIKLLLSSIRKNRAYPFIDKKVQTSWSSMMIRSLFILGTIDEKYKRRAIKSLDKLMNTMYVDNKLYHSTLIHKTPKVEAFLEDYAFLAQAQLSAYKYTQDELYLISAQNFANKALEEFYDNGMWNFSNGEFETKADTADNTYTSDVNVMLDVLLTLGILLEDEKYTHFAHKTFEYNSYELARKPIYFPYMLTQMLRYLKGDRIIKSNAKNLSTHSFELLTLNYPFILNKTSEDNGFMVCGDKSCFANTDDINDLNKLITNSF